MTGKTAKPKAHVQPLAEADLDAVRGAGKSASFFDEADALFGNPKGFSESTSDNGI